MSAVAAATVGDHPLNVYEYCAVEAFVGVAPLYTGTVPYFTSSVVFNVVPFSFFHVIV